MRLEDLKFGNVVELRNGERYVLGVFGVHEFFISLNNGICIEIEKNNDDLTNKHFNSFDIIKVYKNYTCQELLWERKEKPKLTEDEIVILRNVPKGFKFITRNKNNYLKLHINRPIKIENCDNWQANGVAERFYFFNHLFQFIKWEDDEPYLIADLLKEQEDE